MRSVLERPLIGPPTSIDTIFRTMKISSGPILKPAILSILPKSWAVHEAGRAMNPFDSRFDADPL
jgi:hypothetical protein